MTTYRHEYGSFKELTEKRNNLIENIQKLTPNYYHIRASSKELDGKWYLLIEVDG